MLKKKGKKIRDKTIEIINKRIAKCKSFTFLSNLKTP